MHYITLIYLKISLNINYLEWNILQTQAINYATIIDYLYQI